MPELDNIEAAPEGALFASDPTLYKEPDNRGILAKRFTVVPFSVLDARQGNWQDRKRAWVQRLELRGEEGRQDIAAANNICSEDWGRGAQSEFYAENPDRVAGHGLSESQERLNKFARANKLDAKDAGRCFGQDIMRGEHTVGEDAENDRDGIAGTSIFDPVLCESMYKWFAPKGGRILDPFAGGSTRGVVANFLGYDYTGVDIRPEQVAANYRQAENTAALVLKASGDVMKIPNWIVGDSTRLLEVLDDNFAGDDFDFVWTCPPYYNLEIYSQKEGDGSQFDNYPAFIAWYKDIFRQACSRLKRNRFIGITIGDVRHDVEKLHSYCNLETDTVRVMEELGYRHYNRFVLVTAVGSLPVRIGAQFPKYRKAGNTHQMVYIFWKGDCDHHAIPRELGVLGADEFDIKGAANGV